MLSTHALYILLHFDAAACCTYFCVHVLGLLAFLDQEPSLYFASFSSYLCGGTDLEIQREINMKMSAKKSRTSKSNNSGSSGTTTTAMERKEIERRRRQQMKSLCVKLASLIPKEHYSKTAITQLGSLDEAATYIKKLKVRVEELRQKRSSARLLSAMKGGEGGGGASTSAETTTSGGAGSEEAGQQEAMVEVRQHSDGSALDVVLISSVERPFKLHEVVTVLEEEGAETINANFSVAAGNKIFYTIHCRAFSPRIGIEVSRVSERLRALAGMTRH